MLTAAYGDPPAIQHVLSSNSIWDPNLLANPPVRTITTTGISTHWYDVNGNPIIGPWHEPIPYLDPLQPLPVVTVPNVVLPELTVPQILELMRALQAGQLNAKPAVVEEKKVEEPEEEAPVPRKRFLRVVEP